MKNNTIAIALAALLLGGVATAGFMNSRADSRSEVYPERMGLADGDARMAYDNAIPASGRLEYAQVVGVEPIIESEQLYATVIGTEPVRESSTTSSPQQVCEDVVGRSACRSATATSAAPWPARWSAACWATRSAAAAGASWPLWAARWPAA